MSDIFYTKKWHRKMHLHRCVRPKCTWPGTSRAKLQIKFTSRIEPRVSARISASNDHYTKESSTILTSWSICTFPARARFRCILSPTVFPQRLIPSAVRYICRLQGVRVRRQIHLSARRQQMHPSLSHMSPVTQKCRRSLHTFVLTYVCESMFIAEMYLFCVIQHPNTVQNWP